MFRIFGESFSSFSERSTKLDVFSFELGDVSQASVMLGHSPEYQHPCCFGPGASALPTQTVPAG